MRRTLVLSAVLVLGVMSAWLYGAQQPAAPPPAVNPANFSGTVTPRSTADIRLNRYHFDLGARTNWHSHEGGQVIYIEEGRLRVQDRGQPTREFDQGSTFRVAPGVTHWHGALPGAGITQISLSFGTTTWMEKVSEQDYARR